MGLLDTMFSCSPAVFAILYASVFSGGHFEDPENQNTAGFMLMFAVLNGVTNLLCVFVLREVPPDCAQLNILSDALVSQYHSTGSSRIIQDVDSSGFEMGSAEKTFDEETCLGSSSNDSNNGEAHPIAKHLDSYMPYLKVVISTDFQLLLWTFCINLASALMIYNNITVVLNSVDLVEHQTVFVVIISAVGLPAHIVISLFSDYFINSIPRSSLLVLAGALNLLCHILCAIDIDLYSALLTVTILTGITQSIVGIVGPTITSEMFDIGHFGFNTGVFLFTFPILSLFMQWIFGSVFDRNSPSGMRDCTGTICFRDTFIISSCLILVVMVTSIILFIRTK